MTVVKWSFPARLRFLCFYARCKRNKKWNELSWEFFLVWLHLKNCVFVYVQNFKLIVQLYALTIVWIVDVVNVCDWLLFWNPHNDEWECFEKPHSLMYLSFLYGQIRRNLRARFKTSQNYSFSLLFTLGFFVRWMFLLVCVLYFAEIFLLKQTVNMNQSKYSPFSIFNFLTFAFIFSDHFLTLSSNGIW